MESIGEPNVVNQHLGFMEILQLNAAGSHHDQFLAVFPGVGTFIKDHAHIHPFPGFLFKGTDNHAPERIGAEAIMVNVDGLRRIVQIFHQLFPLFPPFREQGYRIAFLRDKAGIFLHQGRQFLISRCYARISRGIHHLRNVRLIQRSPVAAAREGQRSKGQE